MRDTIRLLFDDDIKIHCENGPAMMLDSGPPAWFVHGERAKTYTEFQELSGISSKDLLVLKLKWGEMATD